MVRTVRYGSPEAARRRAAEDIRLISAVFVLCGGLITTVYVWGRILLPAVGLNAPTWGTWFWSIVTPLGVLLAFLAAVVGVAGRRK